MAENIKAIKEQISSVSNLKKITRAMEMVARSKMKRAIDAAVAARPYTERVLALLHDLDAEEEGAESTHPLLTKRDGEVELIIHIASEKGLCGGYNAQALRKLHAHTGGRNAREVHGISVGKYAGQHIERVGAFYLQHFNVGEKPEVRDAKKIADFVIERYNTGDYHKVSVLYTHFETVFSQKTVVRQLLPLTIESRETVATTNESERKIDSPNRETADGQEAETRHRFEPSKKIIFESILPGLVTTQVYQALLEAEASEQSSRMVAMKSATDNATTFGGALTLKYNRARQASITREIIEIAAGADAV
ncbi:MAG: ATP synthase F1 subunit gamma [Candidatus Paceibacterota bacterium]